MKSLRRIHRPRNREAQRRQRERNQKHHGSNQQHLQRSKMNPRKRREDEEDQSLDRRERRPAQNLAQHNRGTRHRRHQHGKQKALLAVLDDRHHGEDRSEEHDHDQRAGVEVVEIMLLPRPTARTKRSAEPRADHQPENQWRREHSNHPCRLPVEPHDFPPPQGEGGEEHSRRSRRRRSRQSCTLSGQIQLAFATGVFAGAATSFLCRKLSMP